MARNPKPWSPKPHQLGDLHPSEYEKLRRLKDKKLAKAVDDEAAAALNKKPEAME